MNNRFLPKLPAIVFLSIFLLLLVQLYYLNSSLSLQKTVFNNTINQTLEKTLLEERKWRTDSIARSMYRWLVDSTLTRIYSKQHPSSGKTIYYVEDRSASEKQRTDFSLGYENRPIKDDKDPMADTIAQHVVGIFKQSYLSYQTVFYYTATIGDSAVALSDKLRADSLNFRRIYEEELRSEGIEAPFQIKHVFFDDSISFNRISKESANSKAIQTKLYKSDFYYKGDPKYVYAVFDQPYSWILRNLLGPILVSALILVLVAGLLVYFYRTVRKQKQLAALKNDFIDNMTHELKTPISIISAAAEAMQDFGFNNDPQKSNKYLSNIRGQAKQLNNIVSKVLAISTFDKEELKLSPSNFSLNELLGEIKEGISPYLENRAFSIILPEADMRITADRFHLKNVLFNIIDNAVKYNDKDSIEIGVVYQSTADRQSIVITDNGCGIPLEHIEQVFNKFYRVPTGNIQKTRGFGLGLFYVKKMMDAHNGQVKIESVPGKQTTILLTFPKL